MTNEGCTEERRQHSSIAVEARTVTKGGMVIGHGNRDTEHCYLDWLRNNGHLGNQEDADVRYDSGYALRRLFYSFHASAKTLSEIIDGPAFRIESDVETDKDRAELKFYRIMKALPNKYRSIVRRVCTEDVRYNHTQYEFIRDGLDVLYGALHRVNTNTEKKLT